MLYHQGDIVLTNLHLPEGTVPHYFVILSKDEIFLDDELYLGVMITSDLHEDEYSFRLLPELVVNEMRKPCEVRCHLITIFRENMVIKKVSQIKNLAFTTLVDQISDNVMRKD